MLRVSIAALAAALCHSAAAVPPQDHDQLVDLWRYKRDVVLVDSAKRHFDLAQWCWKNSLHPQSTSEVLYALEISDGRFRPAKEALAKMRALDDEVWKRDAKPPNPTLLRSFERSARKAKDEDLRDHVELARWAHGEKLVDEARAVYERVLARAGQPIELDAEGRIRLALGTVPAELSRAIHDSAIEINGRRYLRDEFLASLPDFGAIQEVASDALRVRSPLDAEKVAHLHALGTALLPTLERDLGGRPTERMELFVFPTRASYEAYLDSAGLSAFKAVSGVADRKTFTTVVCAEGADLDALVLHELTHLFQYGIARAVMPDWYAEGLAETYGGQGTFTWDGENLRVRGLVAPQRRELLRDASKLFSVQELTTSNAVGLFGGTDRERAWRFYAQAWAFVRFLREEAGTDVAARFSRWERTCLGAALGAEVGDARSANTLPAQALFDETFGPELEALERRFRAWLATLN